LALLSNWDQSQQRLEALLLDVGRLHLGHAVVVIGGLFILVGQFMSCAVPRESGARGLASSSLVCQIASLMGVGLLAVVQEVPAASAVVLVLTALAALAAHVLYTLFLRQVATYGRDDSAARAALIYLVGSLILCCAVVGLTFFLGASLLVVIVWSVAPLIG